MKYEKSCGAVIIKNIGNENKFLIVSHKGDGYWGFPKGHMEHGESEQETAIREVYEETGLHIELIDNFKTKIEYLIDDDLTKEVVFFIGNITNFKTVKIQDEELEDYKWVSFEEGIDCLTHDDSKRVLSEVFRFLNGR